MMWLWAVLYVGLAAGAARLLVRAGRVPAGDRWTAIVVVYFTLFFGGFHVIGLWELISGQRWVGTPAATALLALVAAAAYWVGQGATEPKLEPVALVVAPSRTGLMAKGTGLLVALLFVSLAVLLLLGPPRGFEVRAYHLPIALEIFHQGSLRILDSAYMFSLPANMSIWTGFFLQVLPEHVASVLNLPFLALAAAMVFLLARLTGADADASLLVAAGLTTIPLFGFSVLELGADVAGCAFIAVAAYFALARPTLRPSWPLLSGLAAGLAFGFKSLQLIPMAAIGLLILLGSLWPSARTPEGSRRTFAPPLLYGLGAGVMAGFWLLRNAVDTGNPLYPVHLAPWFDWLAWPAPPDVDPTLRAQTQLEWVDSSWQWLIYPWVEGHFVDQNFKHSSGLGAFFAATAPIAGVFATVSLLFRPVTGIASDDRMAALAKLLGLGGVIFALWWVLGDRQPRYVMPGIVFLMPVAAWMICKVRRPLRRPYEALLAFCVMAMGFVVFAKLAVEVGGTALGGLDPPRHMRLEYPAAIDSLPKGAVLLNGTDRSRNFALYGAGLDNRVVGASKTRRLLTDQAADQVADVSAAWRFDAGTLRDLGATHIYTHGVLDSTSFECITLIEIDRLTSNPFNGVDFREPRLLYQIRLCDDSPVGG